MVIILIVFASFDHVERLDPFPGPAPEVQSGEVCIGECIEAEAESMAPEANASHELVVRAQVVVLIVLYSHELFSVLGDRVPRQVAGGARYAASLRSSSCHFGPPQSLVSATRVGTGMTVVVATDASFDGGTPGVETVSAVTAIATELGVS
jgi:hypothetical protein